VNPGRILRLAGRELRAGPRSPLFMFIIFIPLLITFLVKAVFLTIFVQEPGLAVLDLGRSVISVESENLSGMDVTIAADEDELTELVAEGVVDAGLLLREGFDEAVRSGGQPLLELSFSESSPPSDRMAVLMSVLGLARSIRDEVVPVEVCIISPESGELLSISDRILPSIVMFVLISAGIFTPAFMLVQERERGTLQALLITPATLAEVLASKALLSFFMTLGLSYLTLALNTVSVLHPWALLATLMTAGVMCVAVGLLYGTIAGSAKTLYTLVKSLNILLIAPVVFYIFPGWPRWIAKLFPTYWFVDPLYRVTLEGSGFADIRGDLSIALLITLLVALSLVPLTHRLRNRI